MLLLNLFWFLVGQGLHVLAQIDAIARAPNNPARSRLEILKDRWTAFVIRVGLSAAIFVLWLQGTLADVLMATGLSIPDSVQKVIALHVTGAIAVLAGYAADSVLGFVPFFKSSIPPAADGK